MMTKQAELKKQAYTSHLKSRALSVLIYLIDRSNKDLSCFPAIPTMAEQLHISVSTVKRALKELADAGYIQKEARFRERNRGQSSNLYILLFVEQTPAPDNDNTLKDEDYIEAVTFAPKTGEANTEIAHITFDTLKSEKHEREIFEVAGTKTLSITHSAIKKASTPVQFEALRKLTLHRFIEKARETAGQFSPYPISDFKWPGVGVILQPP
ncbi:helix-turn-helix domain-containing protein [Fusibacter bizertensis]|jgi:DNA-binding transcriptional MocR family regulator